jgi:hypothetical protein
VPRRCQQAVSSAPGKRFQQTSVIITRHTNIKEKDRNKKQAHQTTHPPTRLLQPQRLANVLLNGQRAGGGFVALGGHAIHHQELAKVPRNGGGKGQEALGALLQERVERVWRWGGGGGWVDGGGWVGG